LPDFITKLREKNQPEPLQKQAFLKGKLPEALEVDDVKGKKDLTVPSACNDHAGN
jgi:hypothetical protein